MPAIIVILALLWAIGTFVAYRYLRSRWSGLHLDLLAIDGYGVLTAAFFWPVLMLPDTWMPGGGGDLASFLYPVYSFAARTIQGGTLPLWNPYLYGGSPFAADMQSGIFYPLNLVTFLIARPFTYQSLEGLVIVHYLLASCFTYVYARTLGLNRLASFVAGIIFAYCGFAVAHLAHYNMLAAAIWLPLILAFFHRAVTRGSLYAAVAAGACFGVSALAGHTQVTLYLGLTLVLYWLWALYTRRDTGVKWQPIAVALPIALAMGVLLAAVQLLPAFELTRLSVRADMTFSAANAFRSTPLNLITLFVPHFFGASASDYWGIQASLTETYAYLGLMPLALAALAVVLRRRATAWWQFFALAAILFLLLSFGEGTPLYGWLYKFVPGFDKVRAAGRFALLFDFSLAILAGIGLHALTGRLPALWRRPYRTFVTRIGMALVAGAVLIAPYLYYALLTSQDKDPVIFKRYQMALDSLNLSLIFLALAVILLLAVLRWPTRRQMLAGGMAALIVLDLFAANQAMNLTHQDVTEGFNHPEIVGFLQREAQGYRIDTMTGIGDTWSPDTALLNGIDDLMGVYNPMLLADYNTYWESLGSRSVPGYDLLGAKYVVANKDVQLDWAKFRPALTDAPKLNVYENTRALPRAMVVSGAEVLPRASMLDRLKSPDFDPSAAVLLENAPAGAPAGAGQATGQVLETDLTDPNAVRLRVQTTGPAYLVLSQAYYPGWKCLVDGQETPILRANYAFQAIQLGPGAHQVQFVFAPRLFTLGCIVTALTVIVIVVVAALALVRRRAQPASAGGHTSPLPLPQGEV